MEIAREAGKSPKIFVTNPLFISRKTISEIKSKCARANAFNFAFNRLETLNVSRVIYYNTLTDRIIRTRHFKLPV